MTGQLLWLQACETSANGVQVDMCIGSVIKLLWQRKKPQEAEAFIPVAASGLIAGDGLWTVPAALLAIGHVNPPICMSFTGAP